MTRNRIATWRWTTAAIVAGGTLVTAAPAQPATAASMSGVYHVSYAGGQDARVRGPIMQPRDRCKDPERPRLHPAVEECIEELQ